MKHKQLWAFLLMALVMILSMGAGVACADQHDRLTPLLGEIEGWQAKPVTGSSLASARLKMISARRVYSKGEKGITLSLMVNSGSIMDSELQDLIVEDDVHKVSNRLVDGFRVKSTFSKSTNSGQVVVYLAYNNEASSKLVAAYSKMDDAEALLSLQKLNWAEMKGVVSSML